MRATSRLYRLALIALALALPGIVRAERLPLKTYTTADGLAHNDVNRIVRDSRGFLWFATNDGLSRFDGYGFTNYTVEQGLPHRTVTDLLETKSGELWVATYGGLVRFRPEGKPAPHVVYENDVGGAPPMFSVIVPADTDPRAWALTVLLESRDGTIWCGTRKGLFRLERGRAGFDLLPIEIGIPDDEWESGYLNDLVQDGHGSLWAAGPRGLYRRWPDGTTARYTLRDGLPGEYLEDLMLDRRGRLWVGSRGGGFFRVTADDSRKPPQVAEVHGLDKTLPLATWVFCLRETSDGRFWVAGVNGLLEFSPDAARADRLRGYARRNGLIHQSATTLGEDADGNLWMGTDIGGAMKLARNGLVTYSEQDWLITALDVFEDAAGGVYVKGLTTKGTPAESYLLTPSAFQTTSGEDYANLWGNISGGRVEWFRLAAPFAFGWVGNGVTLQTRTGEWWIAGDVGIYRFPASASFARLATLRPSQIHRLAEAVYRLFEDSRGDVWVSSVGRSYGLSRWERSAGVLRDIAHAPGLPPARELARSFGEDQSGSVWIGFNTGVARYRDGNFRFFTIGDGVPPGNIMAIYASRAGRLWLASSQGGLIRVEHDDAERPMFTAYTTSHGLSGNSIEAITEDSYGRIYVATGRGIDQLDPETGRVRHFTTDDGLASGAVISAFRDRTGRLWFATYSGLSRFTPAPPAPSPPPAILITGLTVAGETRAVSAIGEAAVTLPDLRYDANQLEISFVALGFAPGESLRYQYRLEGSAGGWSPLGTRRSVSYASLSPGAYRFVVRAVNADGVSSSTPASVAFTVLPPFWQRWWFLSLIAFAAASAMWWLHRYRLARVLELERVRTRIATDLHDDIGANLTRIAILSEVARQAPAAGSWDGAPLASIGSIARESVASMGDIVWAISPARDTLQEVVRKMRHHAEEVFESRAVTLRLDVPGGAETTKLGVDIRRDLLLIFKEAVNNAARHSRCSEVSIALRVSGARLTLEIADNGIGFDAAAANEGNGLASIRRRAALLGGSLEILSDPAAGTTVSLVVPIGGARAAAG